MENKNRRNGKFAICTPNQTKDGNTYYKGILNLYGMVCTTLVFKDDETGNVKVIVTPWETQEKSRGKW